MIFATSDESSVMVVILFLSIAITAFLFYSGWLILRGNEARELYERERRKVIELKTVMSAYVCTDEHRQDDHRCSLCDVLKGYRYEE